MISPDDVNGILSGADDPTSGQPPPAPPGGVAPPPPLPHPDPGPTTVWSHTVPGASVIGVRPSDKLGQTQERQATEKAAADFAKQVAGTHDAAPEKRYGAWIVFDMPTDVESQEFWDAWNSAMGEPIEDPKLRAFGTQVTFRQLTEEQKMILTRMMNMLGFFCPKCKWTLSTWDES